MPQIPCRKAAYLLIISRLQFRLHSLPHESQLSAFKPQTNAQIRPISWPGFHHPQRDKPSEASQIQCTVLTHSCSNGSAKGNSIMPEYQISFVFNIRLESHHVSSNARAILGNMFELPNKSIHHIGLHVLCFAAEVCADSLARSSRRQNYKQWSPQSLVSSPKRTATTLLSLIAFQAPRDLSSQTIS